MNSIQNQASTFLSASQISAVSKQLELVHRTFEQLLKLLAKLSEGDAVNDLSPTEKRGVATQPSLSPQSGGSRKRVGAYAGPAGFLWKPISDSNGKLAVLLPSNMTGTVRGVAILAPDGRLLEQGRNAGVGNGGREHFRFSRSGNAYPEGCQVAITRSDGTTQRIAILKPNERTEGR